MLPSELINELIKSRGYKSYLEIGIQRCSTFNRVVCEKKIGVDPVWSEEHDKLINSGGVVYKITSDEYFNLPLLPMFDVIFIDGLHEKDQVLKDIYNALRLLNSKGIILIHDCLPKEENNQGSYHGGDWTGDVWKAMVEVRKAPIVDSVTVDIDWGVGLIIVRPNSQILNCSNSDLKWEDYVANRDNYLRVIDYTGVNKFLEGY
jgi:hypothetical protein